MTKKEIIFLLIILGIAAFFRLWKLNEIPPGLYPDVAINGNEAFFSLKNKDFKVFYPENYGREGLMMWLISFSFLIFGPSIWSIKIVAATIGILTVFGLYLLVKELFSGQESSNIALFSSFFLAISFWHTNLSRIGFRAILLPFILIFSFYFLLKSLRKRSFIEAIWAGIFFGFGFYTYTSFRMAVLILPVVLVPYYFLYQKKGVQKKFLLSTLCFLLSTFIVALPIGVYFLKNPEHFISRAAPVTIFSTENPAKEFFKSLILHLGMFNFYGDPNWRHNFSQKPMLSWPVGILFLIGIILIFREIFIKSNYRENNFQKLSAFYLLLSSFFIMLLPGILTREGIPHSLRAIGVVPPVFIFTGMGANLIFEKIERIKKYSHILKNIGIVVLSLILILEGKRYFWDWAKRLEVKSEFNSEYVEMGNYLNSLPENFKKYVIVNKGGMPISWANNIPIPAQTLMFLEISKFGEIKSRYLFPNELEKIKIEEKGVIVIIQEDKSVFDNLALLIPKGKLKKEKDFWVYKVGF